MKHWRPLLILAALLALSACTARLPPAPTTTAQPGPGATATRPSTATPTPEKVVLTGHTSAVHSMAWSPDGRTLASRSRDGTVILWDAKTGEQLHTLQGHSGRVSSVAFSPDGKRLASASEDGTVILWRVAR